MNCRIIRVFSMVAISSVFAGCAPTFSVVRPVTDQPASFAVIPSAASSDEGDFAAFVEKALLRLGLRVVERPAFRFMDSGTTRTDSMSSAAASNVGGSVVVGEGQSKSVTRPVGLIDVVSMYDDSRADYIVVTYVGPIRAPARVRIIRRQDKSIFGSIDFEPDSSMNVEGVGKLYSAFVAGGILKGKGEEMRCSSVPVPK